MEKAYLLLQSTFLNQPFPNLDTDGIMYDILDMEKENMPQNFDIKCDISDAELVKVTQEMEEAETRFAAPMNKADIDDLVKKWPFEKTKTKTETKTKCALALFRNGKPNDKRNKVGKEGLKRWKCDKEK